jgi:hypothetical protein
LTRGVGSMVLKESENSSQESLDLVSSKINAAMTALIRTTTRKCFISALCKKNVSGDNTIEFPMIDRSKSKQIILLIQANTINT